MDLSTTEAALRPSTLGDLLTRAASATAVVLVGEPAVAPVSPA